MDSPVYMESPSHDRNPSPPPEIRDHGELVDAESIGNTAFSKHWLFSTLMKLIEAVDRENEDGPDLVVDVDEDLQNELCSLWDMSMNSEVAVFLEEFKAVEILAGIIDKSKAPRVTEICVGILGNMACEPTVCQHMSSNARYIELVLLLLEMRDTPTLVETTRLIYTSLSNTGARGQWIKAVQRSEDTLSHLQFIFESSTNCDLLKNAAELVDTLLDLEGDICVSWATIEFIRALLEATQQIGSEHCSEALEVYLHIFQSFSTAEPGVEALVHHMPRLQNKVLKYLNIVCEYEIVGIGDKEEPLTSALSVLNVLFSTQVTNGFCDGALKLYTDEQLMRVFLKILEPLYPMLEKCKAEIQALKNSNSVDGPITELDHVTSTDQSDNGTDHVASISQSDNQSDNEKNGGHSSSKGGDKLERTESRIEEEYRKLSILYEILSGFLLDYFKFLFSDIVADRETTDFIKRIKPPEDTKGNNPSEDTNGSNLSGDIKGCNPSADIKGSNPEDTATGSNASDVKNGINSENKEDENDKNNSSMSGETKCSETCENTKSLEKGANYENTASTKGDNSHICYSVITYLDEACSRSRINYLALTLMNLTTQASDGLMDSLLVVAERFGKRRLSRVLSDVCAGRVVRRAESAATREDEES